MTKPEPWLRCPPDSQVTIPVARIALRSAADQGGRRLSPLYIKTSTCFASFPLHVFDRIEGLDARTAVFPTTYLTIPSRTKISCLNGVQDTISHAELRAEQSRLALLRGDHPNERCHVSYAGKYREAQIRKAASHSRCATSPSARSELQTLYNRSNCRGLEDSMVFSRSASLTCSLGRTVESATGVKEIAAAIRSHPTPDEQRTERNQQNTTFHALSVGSAILGFVLCGTTRLELSQRQPFAQFHYVSLDRSPGSEPPWMRRITGAAEFFGQLQQGQLALCTLCGRGHRSSPCSWFVGHLPIYRRPRCPP